MIFIGDVHAEFARYRALVERVRPETSIQLGDMGMGFGLDGDYKCIPYHHHFIRGNHDDVRACERHPQYLGDYGYYNPRDVDPKAEEGVFFVGGAYSPDFYHREVGINWWEDEELDDTQMEKAVELYDRVKPRIVATHDCPQILLQLMYSKSRIFHTRTGSFLNMLFDIHKPKAWVFGHHHKSHHFSLRGTEFFGLRSLEMIRLTEKELGE